MVYRKQSLLIQEFYQILEYLLTINSIDIIARTFNYDLLKALENKLLDIFTEHAEMINQTIHEYRSWIDRVYIEKALIKEFSTYLTVENIIFQIMML